MNNSLIIITGMMAVTYIPRLLPFLMISEKKIHARLRRFLSYIPYTALGALIVPGVMDAVPGNSTASIAGIVFAVIISWFFRGIIIPVFGSIAVTYLFMTITNYNIF